MHFKIDGVQIQQVECSKYLGILIEPGKITYIYTKIIKLTSIFVRLDKINIDVAKMIYFAFVHSHLAYGTEIHGNTYNKHLNRLIILNNKLLCILQRYHVILLLSNFIHILTHSLFPNFIIIKF